MTSHELITLAVEDGLATLTLNRPDKRNAMTVAMWCLLTDLCAEIADRADVRAVVLRGAGTSFCSGADISALSEDDAALKTVVAQAESALHGLLVPTVAVISGHCWGGGVQLAVACDLRIATDDATFATPPAKLGVVYPAPSIEGMVALIGPAASKRLLFTATPVDAATALHLGLVDQVVTAEELEATVADLLGSMASLSLLSQCAAKAMVNAVGAHDTAATAAHDTAATAAHDTAATAAHDTAATAAGDTAAVYRRWIEVWAASADSVEGPASFLERRPARFTWTTRDAHPVDPCRGMVAPGEA